MRAGTPVLLLLVAVVLAGCSSDACPRWGSTASLRPAGSQVRCALADALLDPQTLVPAAAALLFGLTDADEEVSDWARRDTPLFGSTGGAQTAGEVLLGTSAALTLASALAAPSGVGAREVRRNKARGLGIEALAVGSAAGLAFLGKGTTGRVRPDASDDQGFPSGHAASASALSAMTWRNADWLCTSPRRRTALKATATGVALLTGWARVEAGAHFPSDVLAGHALGNATSRFLHDSFLGRRAWALRTGWRRDRGTITLGLDLDL